MSVLSGHAIEEEPKIIEEYVSNGIVKLQLLYPLFI